MPLRSRIVLIFGLATALLLATIGVPLWLVQDMTETALVETRTRAQVAGWHAALAEAVTPYDILAAQLAADQPLQAAVASGEAARTAQLLVERQVRNAIVRLDILGGDGRLFASSAGAAADSPMIDTTNLRNRVRADPWLRSVDVAPDGTVLVVLVANFGVDSFVSIAVTPEPALRTLERDGQSALYLLDRVGRLQLSTAPADWPRIEAVRKRSGDRPVTIERGGRAASVMSIPLFDLGQSRVATLVSVTDVTVATQERSLVLLITVSVAALVFAALLMTLYGFAKGALDPLGEITRVVRAMAAGDDTISADVPNRRDEIGAIAAALEVFRRDIVTLARTKTRETLRAAQQQLLIRREMETLAGVLDATERDELLAGWQGTQAESGAELAEAFRQMAARVVAQHAKVADLLAERSRDLATVRQALTERAQLIRLRQELDLARNLQLSSLPRVFPPFPGRTDFEVYAAIEPAREVGGDFYDFALIGGDRLAVMIGDASGKGVSAALFIAMARSILHSAVVRGASPAQALLLANGTLAVENHTMMFATVFVGVLDLHTGWLSYASAGHNPPYLVTPDGAVRALAGHSGIALGIVEDAEYEDGDVAVPRGGSILLFTDGVTEATAPDLGMFGEAMLEAELAGLSGGNPEEMVRAIQQAVRRFAAGMEQADDITVLAARWLRPAEAAVALRPQLSEAER